ncbi:MAG: hypothetical protein ABEJ57_03145 [Halobacteriaceae archaeon]
MGVIETLQTAGAVVLAAPIAMLGVAYLGDGRSLGAVFLAIAVLLVVLQHWLLTPSDIPGVAAERAAEAIVTDDEDDG